jgi:hypothetical protein
MYFEAEAISPSFNREIIFFTRLSGLVQEKMNRGITMNVIFLNVSIADFKIFLFFLLIFYLIFYLSFNKDIQELNNSHMSLSLILIRKTTHRIL